MLEILQFVFTDFKHFVGTLILLVIVLNTFVSISKTKWKYKSEISNGYKKRLIRKTPQTPKDKK